MPSSRASTTMGWLEKLSTPQFYDAQAGTFLNGRQVIGRCPCRAASPRRPTPTSAIWVISTTRSTSSLPNPRSRVRLPRCAEVSNWYFELPRFHDLIADHIEQIAGQCGTRRVLVDEVESFLAPPIIYVQEKFADDFAAIEAELPEHTVLPAEKGKSSFGVEFASIAERERAVEVMHAHALRFRTGKTLVPFRLTGNIEWGVKAPDLDGTLPDATVWCWPESLWAPIAFSQAALEESGRDASDWRAWWCSDDAKVYQFIGQDNIYFYGVAQTALWQGTQAGHEPRASMARATSCARRRSFPTTTSSSWARRPRARARSSRRWPPSCSTTTRPSSCARIGSRLAWG